MPSEDIIKVCIDMILEGEEQVEAARLAVEERIDNLPIIDMPPGSVATPQPLEMAILTRTLWKPGRVLRVRFMDGDPVVQAKVEQVARTWEQFANIKFAFGDDPESEIRIAFLFGQGSWSWMGTDAKLKEFNEPTMNLGWLTRDTPGEEYDRVVLHEFGHALGCIHEHQAPPGQIPWDKPAVYRYYSQFPDWDKAKIDFNVFHRYSVSQTQFTEFDPQSIMVYPIPNELTIGDFEVPMNKKLSETDKSFIGTVYPFDTKPVVDLVVDAPATDADIGEHAEEDLFRFTLVDAGEYTAETSGPTDVAMGLFGPDDRGKQQASDDDSGRGLNAKISMHLGPGMYYLRVRHFRPQGIGKYAVSVKRGT